MVTKNTKADKARIGARIPKELKEQIDKLVKPPTRYEQTQIIVWCLEHSLPLIEKRKLPVLKK